MKSKIIECCEFCVKNMNKKVKGFVIKCNFNCYHYACEKCYKKLISQEKKHDKPSRK